MFDFFTSNLEVERFLDQEVVGFFGFSLKKIRIQFFFENLILVQDERWRRALSMQVERFPQGSSGRRVSIT